MGVSGSNRNGSAPNQRVSSAYSPSPPRSFLSTTTARRRRSINGRSTYTVLISEDFPTPIIPSTHTFGEVIGAGLVGGERVVRDHRRGQLVGADHHPAFIAGGADDRGVQHLGLPGGGRRALPPDLQEPAATGPAGVRPRAPRRREHDAVPGGLVHGSGAPGTRSSVAFRDRTTAACAGDHGATSRAMSTTTTAVIGSASSSGVRSRSGRAARPAAACVDGGGCGGHRVMVFLRGGGADPAQRPGQHGFRRRGSCPGRAARWWRARRTGWCPASRGG